jgi:hypothetical protein
VGGALRRVVTLRDGWVVGDVSNDRRTPVPAAGGRS